LCCIDAKLGVSYSLTNDVDDRLTHSWLRWLHARAITFPLYRCAAVAEVHRDDQEAAHVSEWHLVFVLVAFVIGFVSGILYALRLYKRIETDSDREWAKRHGMRETRTQYGDLPVGINPLLRRRIL
jgi:hypothetical protein